MKEESRNAAVQACIGFASIDVWFGRWVHSKRVFAIVVAENKIFDSDCLETCLFDGSKGSK